VLKQEHERLFVCIIVVVMDGNFHQRALYNDILFQIILQLSIKHLLDKDKVLKQEHERNLDDSLYVIKGSKEDALLKAEELSETGDGW
jgi:hypothetical protein